MPQTPDPEYRDLKFDPARARAAHFPTLVGAAHDLLHPDRTLAQKHAARVGGSADDDTEVILAADGGGSYSYKGVEIARVGSFDCMTGKCAFSREDFDNAVQAWESLKGKFDAPIKLGHNDEQNATNADGLPAAGWLSNLRRAGDRLVADFIGVPEGVARLIENGTLRKRSIEALRNVTIAGKKWPFVISGLALLGRELPAVDSLKDIVEVFGAAGVEMVTSDESQLVLAAAALAAGEGEREPDDRAAGMQELFDLLLQLEEKASPLIKNRRGAPQSRALFSAFRKQLREAIGQSAAGRKEDGVDPKEIRKALGLAEDATDEQVNAALALARGMLGLGADAKDEDVAAAAKNARDSRKDPEPKNDPAPTEGDSAALRRDLASALQRIAVLEGNGQESRITGMVDEAIKAGKVMPASRDALVKMGVADEASLKTYLDGLQVSRPLSTQARGASTGKDGELDLAEFEPSDTDMEVARQMGRTREDVMRDKITARGLEVPDSLKKKDPAKA